MWTNQVKVITYTAGFHRKRNDSLIIDREKTLIVNDEAKIELEYTPTKEKELIMGYLVCNAYVKSENDIKDIKVYEESIIVQIETKKETSESRPRSITEKISAAEISLLTAYFQEGAMLFKDTAISESAALASNSELHHFSEDLHRNNAIYKCLGSALQDKEKIQDFYLLTSAKITKKTVQIANQVGLKFIISRTAPTNSALKEAEDSDICLIGFARGRKCTVYTHTYRLTA